MRLAKRELAAQMSAATGLTRVLEWMPKRRLLMVLNYHRIGDAAQTPYDPGVFSATAEEFNAQITYLKRRFRFSSLGETRGILRGGNLPETSVLITFDDGYIDNYTLAFPILRAHTDFIGTGKLPW
jgi:hypothetical protein